MSAAEYNSILLQLLSVVFVVLVGMLAYFGRETRCEIKELRQEVSNELRAIYTTLTAAVEKTHHTLSELERALRGELVNLDRRMTKVEEKCQVTHERK